MGVELATNRSTDWWLFTEDLPNPENRVTLTPGGRIQIAWKPNNVRAHEVLVRETRKMLRKIGFPVVISEGTGIEVNSHQAGTVRLGTDPATSVLDPSCQAHDVDNLYVVDSSFFPSLPVMNPALSIAANALRVADSIMLEAATPRRVHRTARRSLHKLLTPNSFRFESEEHDCAKAHRWPDGGRHTDP